MTAKTAVRLPCVCANLRRAARVVTQMYESEIRETGLHATQLTLIQALEQAAPITQGELGAILCIDSTTLTRSMRPLVQAGWVKSERGRDRRERVFSLTAPGKRKAREAARSWRRAQTRFKKAFGPNWDRLEADLSRIAEAV